VEVRTWEALADGVLDALVLARMEDHWPPREGQRSPAWVQRQLSRVTASLGAMGQGLGDKPWCCGTHFSLADIAVGCALGYLDYRYAHIDWRTPHPNLARLYDKLKARPSFSDCGPPAA
jgi:glutathione S-transferase